LRVRDKENPSKGWGVWDRRENGWGEEQVGSVTEPTKKIIEALYGHLQRERKFKLKK